MNSSLKRATKPAAPTGMSLRTAIVPLLERCFKSGGILSYHAIVESDVPSPEMHIHVETLRAQLEYVRDRYNVIPLSEFVRRRSDTSSLDRCVAITFDDAYVGVERLAAPLLAHLGLPATIFVTAGAAENGISFWWDLLEHARGTSPDLLWPRVLNDLGIEQLPPTREALGVVRDRILCECAGRIDRQQIELAEPSSELLRSMSFEALERLARDERFEFGCHTVTHPALPFLSSADQRREMSQAQRSLEEVLPRVLPIVAYPFGLYDRTTLSEAAKAGFRGGVTMQARGVARRDLPLALPRVGVSEDWSPGAISLRLNAAMRPLFRARAGTHPRLPANSTRNLDA